MTEHRRSAEGDDHAACFREFLQLRNRVLDGDASELTAIFLGELVRAGLTSAATTAEATAAAVGLRNAAVGEKNDVVLRLEVAGVERVREDALEVELELLEQPADVARRHRAAIHVPQADARLGQLVDRARRTRRDRGEVEAEIERGLVEHRLRRRLGGDENHAGAVRALIL